MEQQHVQPHRSDADVINMTGVTDLKDAATRAGPPPPLLFVGHRPVSSRWRKWRQKRLQKWRQQGGCMSGSRRARAGRTRGMWMNDERFTWD